MRRRRSRVRPTARAGSGNVHTRQMADGVAQAFRRRPRAGGRRGACGRHRPGTNGRHRCGPGACRPKSTRSSSTSRGARSRSARRPVAIFATGGFGRAELAPFSDLDLLVLCAKTPGDDVQKLAEAILYPLWDAKVDAGPRGAGLRPGAGAARQRSGGRDGAARRALPDRRSGAGRQVPGRVPGPGREDGGGGLRGAPARRAEGTPQPLRRHDLPARARSQERPGRPARSVRRALGGDGALRDVRSEAAARARA